MALTRDQIDDLAEEGVFLGNIYEIAQAIEAEVRKHDDELIRQMDAALDASEAFLLSAGFESSDAFQEVSAALTAGRARLEGKK